MDVRAYILLIALTCGAAHPLLDSAESPTEGINAVAAETSTSAGVNVETTPSSTANCTTSRDMPGACVLRANCDHGTPAVDLTLYATKGYIKFCVRLRLLGLKYTVFYTVVGYSNHDNPCTWVAVRTCKAEEVCCPFNAMILNGGTSSSSGSQPTPGNDNDAAFEFDDDD